MRNTGISSSGVEVSRFDKVKMPSSLSFTLIRCVGYHRRVFLMSPIFISCHFDPSMREILIPWIFLTVVSMMLPNNCILPNPFDVKGQGSRKERTNGRFLHRQ